MVPLFTRVSACRCEWFGRQLLLQEHAGHVAGHTYLHQFRFDHSVGHETDLRVYIGWLPGIWLPAQALRVHCWIAWWPRMVGHECDCRRSVQRVLFSSAVFYWHMCWKRAFRSSSRGTQPWRVSRGDDCTRYFGLLLSWETQIFSETNPTALLCNSLLANCNPQYGGHRLLVLFWPLGLVVGF